MTLLRVLFVGALRTAKGQAGLSLVNVAAVHELGSRPIVLEPTPKVRRFLHAAFRAAGLDAPARDRPSTASRNVDRPVNRVGEARLESPVFLDVKVPGFTALVENEAALDQARSHSLDHCGVSAQEDVEVLRRQGEARSLLDDTRQGHVLEMPYESLP